MTSFSSALLVLIVSVLVHESCVSAQCDSQAKCISDIYTLRNNLDIATAALNNKITSCNFKCPAGFKQIPGVAKCIQVVPAGISWEAGQRKCVELNPQASLVAIENQAENDFVEAELNAVIGSGANPTYGTYIGGRRADGTCNTKYMWQTAAGNQHLVTFSDWGTNQPDCYGNKEACITYTRQAGAFIWNDIDCGLGTWIICQVTA